MTPLQAAHSSTLAPLGLGGGVAVAVAVAVAWAGAWAVAVAEAVAATTRRRQHLLLLAHPALHLLLAHPAECPGRSGILVGIESPKGCARYNHI